MTRSTPDHGDSHGRARAGAVVYWLASGAPGGAAALAVIELMEAGDAHSPGAGQALSGFLDACTGGRRGVEAGTARVRGVWGVRGGGGGEGAGDAGGGGGGDVDEVVVARWSAGRASVVCHAGPAVVRGVLGAFERAGATPRRPAGQGRSAASEPCRWPEAGGPLQGAMLDALARAASPAAVGLLLDQPRRWRAWLDGHGRADLALDPAQIDAAVGRLGAEGLAPAQHLNRLIDPALALILGPPNVGKSTLTNLLAGRRVSITADEPGTTRDHVGVLLELDGQGPAGAQAAVAVRWADTPGIGLLGAGAADCAAEALALALAQEADVIVRAGDAVSGWGGAQGSPGNAAVLWANLRADLGPAPGWGAAGAPAAPLAVRADRPETIEALARAVRRAVVPDAAIGHPGPWRFW